MTCIQHTQCICFRNGTVNPGNGSYLQTKPRKRVGGDEGDIIYAEICWRSSRSYNTAEIFKGNKLSWSRIKRGFQAREKKYGPSYRYMNALCFLAGGWGDKITTRILVKKLGDRWEPDFWEEKKYFDNYKKWAFDIHN